MLAMQLGRFVPSMQKYDGNTLIQKLPQVIQELGLSINKPIGVTFWKEGYRSLMVLSFSIEVKKILSSLKPIMKMRRTQIVFEPKVGPIQQVIVQLGNKKMPVALITGSRLHIVMPKSLRGRRLRLSQQIPFLTRLTKAYKDPLQHALTNLSQELQEGIQQKDADLFFHLAHLPLNEVPVPPQFHKLRNKIQKLFRSFSLTLSLKRGLALHNTIGWHGKMPWFLQVLQPTQKGHFWGKWVPSHVGWMGHLHINHDVIPSLYQKFKTQGWIPAAIAAKIEKGWNKAIAETKKEGIDFPALFRAWNGEWVSGMLWHDKLAASILNKQIPFTDNFKGVFAMVGFKSKAGTTLAMNMLQHAWNKSKLKNKIKGYKPTLIPAQIAGLSGFAFAIPTFQPVYILAHKNMILFAGHRSTVEAFVNVWKGKKPSLQQAAQHPQTLARLQKFKRLFVLFPQVTWDLMAMLAPPKIQKRLEPLLNHVQGYHLWSHLTPQAFLSSMAIEISKKRLRTKEQNQSRYQQLQAWKKTPTSKPTSKLHRKDGVVAGLALGVSAFSIYYTSPIVVGILAAVTIPAFLKYIRKSKTSEAKLNLRVISNGAVLWYNNEHANSKGNPLPKHFPGRGLGWICTPTKKPCFHGRTMYPSNLKLWDKTPWKQLKFSITRKHYFQYCYKSEGVGTKATFTIRAHADLDCDSKLSTYKLLGTVNSATGEVQRSKLIIRKAIE